jgi:hypothetical protein
LSQMYDPSTEEGTAFVPAPSILGSLEQGALQSMLPAIKAELSLVNSIYELKDLKSLASSITLGMNTVQSFFRKIEGFGSGFSLRRLLRGASDNYLQYKFNVGPLLHDVASLFKATHSIEKRLRTLINESARLQTKHFHYVFREFEDTEGTSTSSYQLAGDSYPVTIKGCTATLHTQWEASQFNATIRYNYNLPELRGEHALLLGLLDGLGVNLNPQIIWNAIPWTFVIDWVFDVSRFLKQFTVHNIEPVVNIRNYCWSIKRARKTYGFLTVGENPFGMPFISNSSMPTINDTSYRRVVKWPSYSWIQSSGLSPTEVTLGAALAFARRPRYKRTEDFISLLKGLKRKRPGSQGPGPRGG